MKRLQVKIPKELYYHFKNFCITEEGHENYVVSKYTTQALTEFLRSQGGVSQTYAKVCARDLVKYIDIIKNIVALGNNQENPKIDHRALLEIIRQYSPQSDKRSHERCRITLKSSGLLERSHADTVWNRDYSINLHIGRLLIQKWKQEAKR